MLISQLAATYVTPRSTPSPYSRLRSRHSVKSALQEAGYHNTTELLQTAASDLSAGQLHQKSKSWTWLMSSELSIPLSQAEDIIRQCRNPPGKRLISPVA